MKQILEQFGIVSSESNRHINSSRLKEKLLAEIRELEAHSTGSGVIFACTKDVGFALSQASNYSEAIIISKAAKILLRHMIDHEFKGAHLPLGGRSFITLDYLLFLFGMA